MTLMIHFHQSRYRGFKAYYLLHVQVHLKTEFPAQVSYSRLVEWMPAVLIALCAYLQRRKGAPPGIAFVDATSIAVCHNRRIHRHQVFQKLARRGKTSVDWFYGFKRHLVVNDPGEPLGFSVTPGNGADRQVVPTLVKGLTGKLFGDQGYSSQALFEALLEQRLQLVTRLRNHMKNKLLPLLDKLLLRKRALIETSYDQVNNIAQIEHTRHRSGANFMVNLVAGLIAYTHQPTKPSLNLTQNQLMLLNNKA